MKNRPIRGWLFRRVDGVQWHESRSIGAKSSDASGANLIRKPLIFNGFSPLIGRFQTLSDLVNSCTLTPRFTPPRTSHTIGPDFRGGTDHASSTCKAIGQSIWGANWSVRGSQIDSMSVLLLEFSDPQKARPRVVPRSQGFSTSAVKVAWGSD